MFFIHGAGGTHRVWERQIEFFKDAVAIDLPGHEVGVGKKSIDEYVEEVKRFCDRRGLKIIVMVGHSMGGARCLGRLSMRSRSSSEENHSRFWTLQVRTDSAHKVLRQEWQRNLMRELRGQSKQVLFSCTPFAISTSGVLNAML